MAALIENLELLNTGREQCVIGESDMRQWSNQGQLPSFCMILFCLQGEAKCSFQFTPYTLKKGSLAIVPSYTYPSFSYLSEDFRMFYCFLTDKLYHEVTYGMPSDFYDMAYDYTVVDFPSDIISYMDEWTLMLKRVYADRKNIYRQAVLSGLLSTFFLDHFDKLKRCLGPNVGNEKVDSAVEICRRFYMLVCQHYKEQRRISFYTDLLCITQNYLSFVCKRVMGESPKQLIDKMVILEIKGQLSRTDMSVKQISTYLHFPDSSYMCRYFRKRTGLSPMEYRNSLFQSEE